MKISSPNLRYLLLICLIGLAFGCRKKAPDGFNADFNIGFNNGGMAPDTVVLSPQFLGADSYEWTIEGVSKTGQQVTFNPQSAGSYYVELTVSSDEHKRSNTSTIAIENYPTSGSAMTIVNEDGVIGSFGIDGDAPFWIPIDTIDADGIAGMDYDDNTKQLYYTGSIVRAFPNGAEKEEIFSNDQLQPGARIDDLVIDADDRRVYFAINSDVTKAVASVDLDGNDLNYEFEFTFFEAIQDITLDAALDRVYFTTEFSTAIQYTIQGDVATLYSDNSQKYALVFDNTTQYLYYAEQVFDNNGLTHTNIMRLNPESYNSDIPETWPQVVVENASIAPIQGIDLSESKQQLYWSDSAEKIIYRIDLNNPQEGREVVVRDIENPSALAIGNFD